MKLILKIVIVIQGICLGMIGAIVVVIMVIVVIVGKVGRGLGEIGSILGF